MFSELYDDWHSGPDWVKINCRQVSHELKMSISAHFFPQAIFTHKIGQTDLVFGVISGFISRSVCARLQVSVCSSYNLTTLVSIQLHRQTSFWPAYMNSSASWVNNLKHVTGAVHLAELWLVDTKDSIVVHLSAVNGFVCLYVWNRKFTTSAERNNAGSQTADWCRVVCNYDILVGTYTD